MGFVDGGTGEAVEGTGQKIGVCEALVDNPGEAGTLQAARIREKTVRPKRKQWKFNSRSDLGINYVSSTPI
jgi:hypothetical protein